MRDRAQRTMIVSKVDDACMGEQACDSQCPPQIASLPYDSNSDTSWLYCIKVSLSSMLI